MKRTYFILIWSVVFCFFSKKAEAQYIHFSQYHISPLNTNPAHTGIFNGDQRFAALYRRQWYSVPVEYMTFSGSYDMKFQKDYSKNGFFSAGILFNRDQAGDSDLALTQFGLNGSYTHALAKTALLTAGAQLSYGSRSFKTNRLTWDNQWDGTAFDPTLPPRENFDQTSGGFLDVGAGINLRLQSEKSRSKLDIGVGAFHLNNPQNSFYNDPSVKLPTRIALNAQGTVQIIDKLDFVGNGLVQLQGAYQEIVLTGLLGIYLSTQKSKEVQLLLGAGLRLDDAFFPQAAIAYDGWRVGFSYDINTSPFQTASARRGGPELSIIYIIKKVKPLESVNCRIF